MTILSFFILAHPWARVDLYGKQLNKYVMCTEKNDSKRNISTIVFIPLFWRYKNNEYIQSQSAIKKIKIIFQLIQILKYIEKIGTPWVQVANAILNFGIICQKKGVAYDPLLSVKH